MRLLESQAELTVSIDLDELRLIASAIGEALEAVDDWEFSTRLGYEPSVARRLLSEINEILFHASPPDGSLS